MGTTCSALMRSGSRDVTSSVGRPGSQLVTSAAMTSMACSALSSTTSRSGSAASARPTPRVQSPVSAPSRGTARAAATAATTVAATVALERSQKTCGLVAPISSAHRVLPAPPGPTSVTRLAPPANAAATASSSACLPKKHVPPRAGLDTGDEGGAGGAQR